jgi:SOS response regulatory protein OraA/RecX
VREIRVPFRVFKWPNEFDSLEQVEAFLEKEEARLAKAFALRALARKTYPKGVLLKKLKQKKYSQAVSEKLLVQLEGWGYLNDCGCAKSLIEQKIRQGYGPLWIERYLKQMDLDAGLVRQIYGEARERQAIEKLMSKGKTIQQILRRGFSYDAAAQSFRN